MLFFGGKAILRMIFPIEHWDTILSASETFDADPYLVLSIIKAESNFEIDAESGKGAVGLMQITEPTAAWIAEKTDYPAYDYALLKQPEVNIYFGTWYLAYLLDEYNSDERLALCAYNAGRGNVDKWLQDAEYSSDGKMLENIPFTETRVYVDKIE